MLACCACAAPRASRAFHTGHSTPHAQRQAQRTTLIITPFEAIVNQNRKRTYTTTYGGRHRVATPPPAPTGRYVHKGVLAGGAGGRSPPGKK